MKLTRSLLLSCLLCIVHTACHGNSSGDVLYSNSWAVEVKGGHHIANRLAKKHGFINKGQAGSLENIYHFIDQDSPNRVRRSTSTHHPKHFNLIAEEHVAYVAQQVVKSRVKRDHSIIYSSPTDTSWGSQWYLHRPNGHHMNVEKTWEQDIIGRGGVVSILDDGIEYTHQDLKDNYDPLASYDFNSHDTDPFPRYDYSNENKHGTRCAGEVVANRNGKCGVGAAYGAKVGGVRMLDGDVTDVVEASSLSLNPQHIDIYSSSWGPNDDGATVDGPGPLAKKAFQDGIEKGRGGLGSLFVWAAGNGGRYGDSCNCDGYAVSPYTISVGSAGENDDVPWYLEQCSSTITSTYSSGGTSEKEIVSTDLHGSCTVHHTGTSASAPLAAGIITLALEANANLTWRDVQYLLVYTSNPDIAHENHWTTNGVGLRVSHMFGFGIMDATALVNRARNWVTVTPRMNCSVNVSQTLGDNTVATPGQPLSVKASFSADCEVTYIEHTQALVTLHMLAGQRKDVSISLTSPQGTKSVLLPHRRMDKSRDGLHSWPFMTLHTWGENPDGGNWLFVVEMTGGAKIKLLGLELVVHGTHGTPRSLRDVPALSECDPECKGGCSAPGPSFCDDCNHFRMASSLACVDSCPKGTFQNHHMCRDCPDLCVECSDEHTCVKCADGAVRLDSGLCADRCPSLTFLAQDHSCQSCHHSCLSCDGLTSSDCTECPSQLTLQEGQCVIRDPESCSSGKYFDHRALECRSCHTSCANCTGKDSDQCTVCREEYSRTDDGKCVSAVSLACTSGHYVDQESLQCNPCPDGCSSCTSNTTCSLCDSPLFLTASGVCATMCPNGTVTDNSSRSCLDTHCSEFCLTCHGREAAICSSCSNGSILFENSCVKQCPEHTYKVVGNSTCEHCHGSCASCSGPFATACLSCPNSKYFRGNQCVSTCPPGSFPSDHGGDCQPCPDKCANCSSAGSCDVCQDGHLLLVSNRTCVVECPKGFLKQYSSRSCQPCPSNCDTCFNLDSCNKCDDNHVYYAPNRSCQSQCPDGYFSDPSNANCLECKHPCSTCVSSASKCLSCGRAMAPDKSSNSCLYCCNSDKAIALPCCDCDASSTECIKRNHLEPTEALVFDNKVNNKHVLVGLVVFSALTISMVVIGLGMYFLIRRCTQHSGKLMRYKSLGAQGLEIVDDSGSEAEIFSVQTTNGYTSVNTIDHDRL